MIDRNDDLPVSRQAKGCRISRAAVLPAPDGLADDLALMRRIDELHLDYPFAAAGCSDFSGPRGIRCGASTSHC